MCQPPVAGSGMGLSTGQPCPHEGSHSGCRRHGDKRLRKVFSGGDLKSKQDGMNIHRSEPGNEVGEPRKGCFRLGGQGGLPRGGVVWETCVSEGGSPVSPGEGRSGQRDLLAQGPGTGLNLLCGRGTGGSWLAR